MHVNILRRIKTSSRMFFICMNKLYNYYNYINTDKTITMLIITYFIWAVALLHLFVNKEKVNT